MFDFVRKVGARSLVVAAIAAGALLTSSSADARGGYRGGGWHGGGWGCCAIGFGFYDPLWPGYYAGYWGPGYPYYATPSVTVVQQPLPAQAPVQAAPQSYYYCDNPAGYYPYVQNCSQPWRQIPATPAAAPPGQ